MKFLHYLGIYTACVTIYKGIEYFSEPIDILIHKAFKKKFGKYNSDEKRNKSVNLSENTVGGPISKIGF